MPGYILPEGESMSEKCIQIPNLKNSAPTANIPSYLTHLASPVIPEGVQGKAMPLQSLGVSLFFLTLDLLLILPITQKLPKQANNSHE